MHPSNYKTFFMIFIICLTLDCAHSNDDDKYDNKYVDNCKNDHSKKFKFFLLMLKI